MKKLIMDRVSCHVTARCNLRCKMCAVYIPKLYVYQQNTPHILYSHYEGNHTLDKAICNHAMSK